MGNHSMHTLFIYRLYYFLANRTVLCILCYDSFYPEVD